MWKTIPDISSKRIMRYESSSDGRIRSITVDDQVNLLTRVFINGYWNVYIGKKTTPVHVLVAVAHISKPIEADETWTVDHIISSDKLNNSVDNLRWASKKTQTQNRRKSQRTNISSCPVIAACVKNTEKYNIGDVFQFNSYLDAESLSGVRNDRISDCLLKKQKTHAGFEWTTPAELPNIPGEVWKDINSSHRGQLCISTEGRTGYKFSHGFFKKVSSYEKITQRATDENDEYPTIRVNNVPYKLHRKVWETFMGEIPPGMEIHHIDNNKQNASLSNLKMISHAENIKKAHEDGRFDGKAGQRIPISINGKEYTHAKEAADCLDILECTIKNRVKNPKFSEYIKL